MLRLLRFYLPYRKNLLLAIACNLLMSMFMVISIPVLQPFLQILFSKNDTQTPLAAPGAWSFQNIEQQSAAFFAKMVAEHGRDTALLMVCGLIVFVFFGKNLFRYLSLYFLAPVRNFIIRDFRGKLLEKIHDLPLSYFSSERKGDIMSRVTSDVQEIEWSIVMVLEVLVREPIVVLGSLSFMIFVSPTLTLFVLVLILFTGTIIGTVGRTLKKQSGEVQTRLGTLVSIVEESLGGLRIIKGFNAEGFQNKRFERENTQYAWALTRLLRRRDMASPLSEFLGITVVAVLLWYGSRLVFNGSMSAETFITFLYAFYNVIDPAKSFSQAIYSIRKGLGALERVETVLNAEISIRDSEQALSISDFQDKIEFRNVRFQYAGAEVQALDGIQFELKKGKIIALVGASGAGKSTIADLLPRFYEPSAGEILLDGVPLKNLRLRDVRALMGIVSQEAILFNDSVRNNITFGADNMSDAAVIEAAKAANAHEFIMAIPDAYAANIGDRGSKLSGGQRQRLTIARALLKNPPILILDEATSALDSESEKLVQSALDRLLRNRTALVIAHRLSTVQHADEILVLEKGRIAERGTHADLMQSGKIYRKLVELQSL